MQGLDCSFCKVPFRNKVTESLFFYTSIGSVSCFAFILAVVLYRKHRADMSNESFATLLPIYHQFLRLCAVASAVELVAYSILPFHILDRNSWDVAIVHSFIWTIDQFLSLVTTFMLLSHGLGFRTLKNAVIISSLLSLPVFVLFSVEYRFMWTFQNAWSLACASTLHGGLMVFYITIFVAPIDRIYRRPALNNYLMFLSLQQILLLMSSILRYIIIDFGYCLYVVAEVLTLAVPWILYRTLFYDSLYWQGKLLTSGYFRKDTTTTSILAPLNDTCLIPESAVRLARAMDEMGQLTLLNHSLLRIKTHIFNDPGLTRRGVEVGGKRNNVVLGAGSNARVYSGYYKERSVAIKMMFTPELTPDIVENVCAEAAMLGSLRHVNIVEIVGVCAYPPSVCLVMELCHRGSVHELLHQQRGRDLPKWLIHKICIETANAIQFLHANEPAIIHLDIKPSNLLLDKSFTVKVADLELARRIPHTTREAKRKSQERKCRNRVSWVVPDTINWTAPELLQAGEDAHEPTTKADIYSLAMVIYEVFSRKIPYSDYVSRSQNRQRNSISAELKGREGEKQERESEEEGEKLVGTNSGEPETTLRNVIIRELYRPQIPANMPTALANLVTRGWASNPSARPSARDVYLELLAARSRETKLDRNP